MGWVGAIGRKHSSITQPDPPPGSVPDFGPTDGRQSIITNAVPRTVTDPGGGVSFTTLASLETAINANPSGTKFVHAAGSTVTWSTALNVAAKSPKIYFLGVAGSTSTVIDGGGNNIIGLTGNQTGAPVEIHGGRWTNFGSAGGANFVAPMILRDGWLLEDFVVDNNWSAGFGNQGSNVVVRFGESHHNGENTWRTSEYELDGPKRVDNVYERIHCHHNNTRNSAPGNYAGGVKMLQCARNVGRYIYSHDEAGFALWFDTAEGGALHTGNGFEECVIENCGRSALFLEGVGSGSFLRRNDVRNCGQATTIGGEPYTYQATTSVRVTNSDSSLGGTTRGDISRNVIDFTNAQDGNIGGLLMLWNHDGHPDRLKNWDVHHNQFWLRSTVNQSNQRLGGYDTATTGLEPWNQDIDFFDNEYHVVNTSLNYWAWSADGVGNSDARNYSQWQTHHPGDDIPLALI